MNSLIRQIAILPRSAVNNTLGYNLAYAVLKNPVMDNYERYIDKVKEAAKQATALPL